jgi:hypothetical protein
MRSDSLSEAWTNDPGERTWNAIESTKSNQESSGADDGGSGAPATPSKNGLTEKKDAEELDGWGQPIKPADPDDWDNATPTAEEDWGNITSPHAAPQDETPQESKPRGRGRGGGKRGKGEESGTRGGRGGARGRGERGGDRGGRGREGKGRGGKAVNDGPPKLPEIPISSAEEVDWAKAAGGI